MKRTAAVIGPTPQFVRWAIYHECKFRDHSNIGNRSLPSDAFRQLRSLRALAEGFRENRVHDGICFHPSVLGSPNVEATMHKGFLTEEIYEIYGAESFLNATCGNCPANADVDGQPNWAGCYGWLASHSSWTLDHQKFESADEDVCEAISAAVREHDRLKHSLGEYANWYGLWKLRDFRGKSVQDLLEVLEIAVERNSTSLRSHLDFQHLKSAAECCFQNELTLKTELVPRGHSDGSSWKIFSHCPECFMSREAGESRPCQGCGSRYKPSAERTNRVLGLRPYLNLSQVLGKEETTLAAKAFQNAYRDPDQ